MDKLSNMFVNPSVMESFRYLEKQNRTLAQAFPESEAMKSIKQLTEASMFATAALRESEAMKSFAQLIDASRHATIAFQESEAMKSIKQLTEASMFATAAFRESEAMKSISQLIDASRFTALAFQESESAKRIRELMENQFSPAAIKELNALKQLSELATFDALKILKNSPFNDLYKTGFFDQDPHSRITDFLDLSLSEIDKEISNEIESATDFNDLSDKAKSVLLYLYHQYLLPVFLSYLVYLATEANAINAKEQLQKVSTHAEVKQFVKSSSSNFDRSMLKGYRVTTANNLSLRATPSMKSDVIDTISIGTLVKVIDKDHSRSWLFVEVEFDGKLEQGWISRRYTTYFK